MNKIDQIISEIEEYIDNCKTVPLSKTNISVNKDDITELISELRMTTPSELKKYEKLISNRDEILQDARNKADQILAEANKNREQLVSENEVMQQAYARANEIIKDAGTKAEAIIREGEQEKLAAKQEAKRILDKAVEESNMLKSSIIDYAYAILAELESDVSNTISEMLIRRDRFIEESNAHYQSMLNEVSIYHEGMAGQIQSLLEKVSSDKQAFAIANQERVTIDPMSEFAEEFEDYTVDIQETEE